MKVHSLQLSLAATDGMEVSPSIVYRPKEMKPSNMDDSLRLRKQSITVIG